MGKNQKDKKEGKQENKAAAPSQERKLQEKEIEEKEDTHLKNWGQMTLDGNEKRERIHLYPSLEKWKDMKMLQAVPRRQNMDHVLPALAQIEDDATVEGLLVLLNTSGGDDRCRACYCGDDRVYEYSGGFPCFRRQSFYWGSSGSCFGLFFYRAFGDHDRTSGPYERDGHWNSPDL